MATAAGLHLIDLRAAVGRWATRLRREDRLTEQGYIDLMNVVFGPATVEVDDDTDPRNATRRAAQLLFTNEAGDPINRGSWSHVWKPAVRAVGLPEGYGLRDLRHYYATVLIFGGRTSRRFSSPWAT